MKDAIINNDPIEDKLHVIAVISNPCLFAKRYILFKEFMNRFKLEEPNIILYVVELCYGNQKFIITDSKNTKHLQIRCETPLWHKENMINIAVQKLLPKSWKTFAWIDADIEFESTTWAIDTLKILNGSRDIVQLFSHACDMTKEGQSMSVFNSAGYQYTKGLPFSSKQPNLWHPGFAWAITRKAYEKIGGLYEKAILGSGDNIMMLSLIGKGLKSINMESSPEYINSILEFESVAKTLRFGYVPGVIRHYYHGSKINRRYHERWLILSSNGYNPDIHIKKDENGLIIPTTQFPEKMKNEIYEYFLERNEDE
jgi:hypothetical protein